MSTLDFLVRKYDSATLTPTQLGREGNLSDTHIRRLCKRGVIKGRKIGDRWLIPIAAAAEFLDGETDVA